jgi:GT2 family glycosyltransferase
MNSYFNPKPKGTFGKGSSDDETVEFKTYDKTDEFEQPNVKGLTSIIIPAYFLTYPLFHQTGNCIGSIREHTDPLKTPYEIILVINGNTGIGFKQEDYKNTYADKVIQNEKNEGWTKAVNQGIRVAKGEYIAIINNDVQVYDYWLEDFMECLNEGGLDLVMATPMYGKPFARATEAFMLRQDTMTLGIGETFDNFRDWSCVITRKDLFRELGTFDEEFFVYGSDLDFLKRMDATGKKYKSTKRVNTHHIIGSTSSGMEETPDLMNDAKELLKKKYETV